ncbi:hypothetical protein D3C78_1367420 [compost metagenome]
MHRGARRLKSGIRFAKLVGVALVGQNFAFEINENFLLDLTQFTSVGEFIEQVVRPLIVSGGLDTMHKFTAQALKYRV